MTIDELDPTQVAMPTVVHEALMLPLSSHEVGMLQGIVASWKKNNPFRAQEPAIMRLETKLAFLLTVVISLGDNAELRGLGRQKLAELYAVLEEQKTLMEKSSGG